MFFLAFILFAILIAWLVINGLNEMRWVQAHSHDEEVASDKGIIPSKDDLMHARENFKEKTKNAMADDGIVGRAKQSAKDSVKEDGILGKAKQGAQNSLKEDGVLGKAKQKVQDGGYLDKAKELGKGAGEKLKEAGAAAKNKVDDVRK